VSIVRTPLDIGGSLNMTILGMISITKTPMEPFGEKNNDQSTRTGNNRVSLSGI